MSSFTNAIGLDKRREKKAEAQWGGGPGANQRLRNATMAYGDYATLDRNRFVDLLNRGQDALNTSARAAVDAALPGFQREIQSIREDAIRRGVSTGDLGTSYEGDAASAFQRNVSNAIAGQAMNLYGSRLRAAGHLASETGQTYLDLLNGRMGIEQAAKNQRRGDLESFFTGVMSLFGGL